MRDAPPLYSASLRALLVLLLLAALAPACAPYVMVKGTETGEASLGGERFVTDDGTRLAFRTWLPDGAPRAVIIAVHGMNEYSRAFERPAEIWQARGIAVYAYDQRGFADHPDRGLWPGADNLSGDLVAFARLVKGRHPGVPVYVLGESMGGGVVLLTAARRDFAVDGIVLVAPAAAPYNELPFYMRAPLWFLVHTIPWYPMTGEGLNLRPTDNIQAWREMSRDPRVIKQTRVDAIYGLTQLMDEAARAVPQIRVPTLLLYGCKDDFVRKWMVSWVAEHARAETLDVRVYADRYHWLLRDLQSESVIADIVDWTRRPQARHAANSASSQTDARETIDCPS
jgi:alpha-beta hydrolase superfamily lysophospholipase